MSQPTEQDEPQPEKGQIWRHLHNGMLIRIMTVTPSMVRIKRVRAPLYCRTERLIRQSTLCRWWRLLEDAPKERPAPKIGRFWQHKNGETMQVFWVSKSGLSAQLKVPETRILASIRTTTLHRDWKPKNP